MAVLWNVCCLDTYARRYVGRLQWSPLYTLAVSSINLYINYIYIRVCMLAYSSCTYLNEVNIIIIMTPYYFIKFMLSFPSLPPILPPSFSLSLPREQLTRKGLLCSISPSLRDGDQSISTSMYGCELPLTINRVPVHAPWHR